MTLNIEICVKVMKFLHNAYVALHFTYGLETTLKHGNWFQSNDYVSTALLYNYSLKMVEIKVKLFIFFFLSPDIICTRCTQGSASYIILIASFNSQTVYIKTCMDEHTDRLNWWLIQNTKKTLQFLNKLLVDIYIRSAIKSYLLANIYGMQRRHA